MKWVKSRGNKNLLQYVNWQLLMIPPFYEISKSTEILAAYTVGKVLKQNSNVRADADY